MSEPRSRKPPGSCDPPTSTASFAAFVDAERQTWCIVLRPRRIHHHPRCVSMSTKPGRLTDLSQNGSSGWPCGGERMKQRWLRILTAVALAASLIGGAAPAGMASAGSPGDQTIVITINDSEAGGSYDQVFVKAYAGTTDSGTDVYIYVPVGGIGGAEGVDSLDPAFDHNPNDEFVPCAENDVEDYSITQAQITQLGDQLVNQIVAVNEDHYGELGLADASDPDSDALVVLVYNIQDGAYYDCSETTYTAGYFAP